MPTSYQLTPGNGKRFQWSLSGLKSGWDVKNKNKNTLYFNINPRPHASENQRTNGPVNTHLISWPTKAQKFAKNDALQSQP